MKKTIFLVVAILTLMAMSTGAIACGCGGGKVKPDTRPDIFTKA